MSSYSTNEFRSGLKIMIEGDPYVIVENEFVKPGKGQAFNRVRIRNLRSGRTLERNFRSGDTVEAADIQESEMQYLYNDGDFWHFMEPDTFAQHTAGKEAMGDAAIWLKDGTTCNVLLWNGMPLAVNAPAHVELKIVETDPGHAWRHGHRRPEAGEARDGRRGARAALHQRRRDHPRGYAHGRISIAREGLNHAPTDSRYRAWSGPDRFEIDAHQRLEAARILVVESMCDRAVQVQHPQQLPARNQRHHDLRIRGRIAGDVSRECVHVRHDERAPFRGRRAADTSTHRNAHASGLALEGTDDEVARGEIQ